MSLNFLPKAVILDLEMAPNNACRKIFHWYWRKTLSLSLGSSSFPKKMKRLVKLSCKNASKSVCKAAAARSAKVHAICEQYLSNRILRAEYLQQISFKFLPSNIWSNSVFDTRIDYVTMFSIGFYYCVDSLLLKIIFPWFCNVKSLLLRIISRSCNVAGVQHGVIRFSKI